MIITLEDALATGRGEERPFTCPVGDHSHPTASVNVLKQVWFCYSCHAKGAVDSQRVPTDAELMAMLEPEQAARLLPESFLSLFGVGGYWAERFPMWVCRYLSLGEDPWSGEGTYPVRTQQGRLAGVCRRAVEDGPWPKYKYPRGWAASRSLFPLHPGHHDVLMLTEGAADAAAGWEVGVPSYAVYGAGVNAPQVELVARMCPKAILIGFDNDTAGSRAASQAEAMLGQLAPVYRVDWRQYKDPAEAPPGERRLRCAEALPYSFYGIIEKWEKAASTLAAVYEEEL